MNSSTIAKCWICFATILIATAPVDAYVDPGIAGAMYQVVYAVVFGAIAAWVLRPWHYLLSLLRRRRERHRVVDSRPGE